MRRKGSRRVEARTLVRAVAGFVSALLVLAVVPAGYAVARPSMACGALPTNTTWSANHKYVLGCTVIVLPGETLSIGPGALVQVSPGAGLEVQGKLVAKGTYKNRILFQSTGQWKGIMFDSGASPESIVNYTYITRASVGLGDFPGPLLTDDTFIKDRIAVSSPALETAHAVSPDLSVKNVSIVGGHIGILFRSGGALTAVAHIQRTDIGVDAVHYDRLSIGVDVEHCHVGVRALQGGDGVPATMGGTFYANRVGVEFDTGSSGSLVIHGSRIIGNQIGLDLVVWNNNVDLNKNSIYDNVEYNVDLEAGNPSATVLVPYSDWGTNSLAAIQQKIRDCHSDAALPCLDNPAALVASPAGTSFTIDKVSVLQHIAGQWKPPAAIHTGTPLRIVALIHRVGVPGYVNLGAVLRKGGRVIARIPTKRVGTVNAGAADTRLTAQLRPPATIHGPAMLQVSLRHGPSQRIDTNWQPLSLGSQSVLAKGSPPGGSN